MALDDLQGVIEKLRKMIATHRDYLSGDETRTRQVLIDPLLRELGWDVSDPAAVQLEYRVGQQRADYALMSNGKPVAVIEAKRLGRNLEDDEMMQVLNYANRVGIEYMIVTDGDHWEMHEVFRPTVLEERLLMKFQLSQQLPHKNVLQVLGMWKPNLVSDDSPSTVTQPVFVSPEPTPDHPSSKSDELSEYPLPSDSLGDTNNWCTFEEELYPLGTKPIQLKIGAGIEKQVDVWLNVIHEVATWLASEEILSAKNCPIEVGKWTFINSEAVNRDGTPFKDPQELANGLILDRRSLNTQTQWRGLRKFLKQINFDLSTIQIFYRSSGQTSR
ncbi:hypothetical protein F4X33_18300 [Candidatus Poribacteria bacterium]|nr:hypothetical protein [Candidatus Poribacteria bacterium]